MVGAGGSVIGVVVVVGGMAVTRCLHLTVIAVVIGW